MSTAIIPGRRWALIGLLALAGGSLAGCSGGPKTYPVSGRIVFEKGNLKDWVGEAVEFQSTIEPDTRAFGTIREDGTFTVSTWREGLGLKGAIEGTFRARILMGPEQEESKRPVKGVPTKYAKFDTSGWEITVPVSGEVVLKVQ